MVCSAIVLSSFARLGSLFPTDLMFCYVLLLWYVATLIPVGTQSLNHMHMLYHPTSRNFKVHPKGCKVDRSALGRDWTYFIPSTSMSPPVINHGKSMKHMKLHHLSSVQNPCWLMIIGDYTTQYNPRTGNPYQPTRIQWNERGILNTAQSIGGFLSHRATKYHPFLGFSMK